MERFIVTIKRAQAMLACIEAGRKASAFSEQVREVKIEFDSTCHLLVDSKTNAENFEAFAMQLSNKGLQEPFIVGPVIPKRDTKEWKILLKRVLNFHKKLKLQEFYDSHRSFYEIAGMPAEEHVYRGMHLDHLKS